MIDRDNWYLLNFVKISGDDVPTNDLWFLSHFFDTSTDNVYVAEDLNSDILLTYSANCDVFDSAGILIARSRMDENRLWEFEDTLGNVIKTGNKDLIKAESKFTKKWFNRKY